MVEFVARELTVWIPSKYFVLGLMLLSFSQLLQGGQTNTKSARLGDMQITLLAVRIASDQDIQDYGLRPRAGYKALIVFLRMKNVARYPSCSRLDEWLRVKQGYEYPRSNGFKLQTPQTDRVLPTEESSGAFVFEIKEGTEPVTLKLVRNVIGDDFCAMSQHRDTHIVGPESLSLSLVGLPANTEQSFAPRGQPSAREEKPRVVAQKIETEEQQSNVILMKDSFEYRVFDYGVGRIQVRNQAAKTTNVPEPKPRLVPLPDSLKPKELSDFSERVFWVEFQITNKAEHSIGNPRYFPSLNALRITDNWGNAYSLRYPTFTDVGGSWHGAELPIPGGSERKEQYKPHESSWAVRLVPVEQFVAQIKELRIDLANQFEYPKSYFKFEEPLSRQRDLLRSQVEPNPQELRVKAVTERQVPSSK
jgi:hypothetical protein